MKPLWLSFSLWLIVIVFFTQAQTVTPPSGRYTARGRGTAIIIGISQYKEVTPLQFADRDAVAFAEFLKTQKVPEDNIKLFLNENATRFNIVDELYNTSQSLQKGDRFYFYFGGHGDLEAKIGYENSLLLLYNSPKKDYFQNNEYLQLSELKTWFDELTKKGVEVVFIADACHSGGLIGGKEGLTKTQRALQESWAGITKILSSQANEFSLEGKQWGGGRGIFSYHLVNGLTGLADANKDKKVTLAELNKYLSVNVLREADPNVQTPVVQGNIKQLLAKIDAVSLKKLREDLMRSVPIITEINIKSKEAQMIGELDRTLVETYKKFNKALTEKRLNTFDDEKDYALLHYKKLVAAKIPNHLLQIMKRNLGAGLMERELEIMKDAREKGKGFIFRNEKVITPAIDNLEETMTLFGHSHYFYNYLKARKLVLESQIPKKQFQFTNSQSVDKNLQTRNDYIKEENSKTRNFLLTALQLEPNMISTYALLSSFYRTNEPDSSIYYQEEVVELLPNQAYAWLSLGGSYSLVKYRDANNQPIPHPKAIQYLEKTIELDPTIIQPYSMLGELYMLGKIYNDEAPTSYHDYPKSIYYYEKALSFHEIPEQELLKIDFNDPNSQKKNSYALQNKYYTILYFLNKATDNLPKSEEYLKRLTQKVAVIGSVSAYMGAVFNIYDLCYYDGNDSEIHLKYVLNFLQQALSKAGENLKVASVENKPFQTLQYREILKAIGATHRALKNYTEAETILQQALVYPIADSPAKEKLKLTKIDFLEYQNRFVTIAYNISKLPNGDYHYHIDTNAELFFLKLEQNKPDEAFACLEKAFQQSVIEHGNDISGKFFEELVLKTYKNLDKDRFKTLKATYFTPSEKK